MKQVTVPTYTATIYVGGYDKDWKQQYEMRAAQLILQDYVDGVGLCVTLKEVEYIYSDGNEKGFEVGLINYPRFPSTKEKIREHSLYIAEMLMKAYNQYKVSIVFPDETIMLSKEND